MIFLEATFKISEPDMGGIYMDKQAGLQPIILFIDSQLVSDM